MTKHPAEVLLGPVITERSLEQTAQGKYTFYIAPDANKHDVKRAVEERFQVNVVKVNIVKLPRKPKRVGRYRYWTKERKKAIVTLAEGQTIPDILEAV